MITVCLLYTVKQSWLEKGHKIKCVHKGGDKEVPSWEKKRSGDGDWRYTKAYRRAYLAVGKKDPTRIRA